MKSMIVLALAQIELRLTRVSTVSDAAHGICVCVPDRWAVRPQQARLAVSTFKAASMMAAR